MIRKAEDRKTVINENMRGGPGSVVMTEIACRDEMYSDVRMYTDVVLKHGCGIGYHSHTNESEIIVILRGRALYCDDGNEVVIGPGDVAICGDGHSHSITNNEDDDVEFIAMIPTKH